MPAVGQWNSCSEPTTWLFSCFPPCRISLLQFGYVGKRNISRYKRQHSNLTACHLKTTFSSASKTHGDRRVYHNNWSSAHKPTLSENNLNPWGFIWLTPARFTHDSLSPGKDLFLLHFCTFCPFATINFKVIYQDFMWWANTGLICQFDNELLTFLPILLYKTASALSTWKRFVNTWNCFYCSSLAST